MLMCTILMTPLLFCFPGNIRIELQTANELEYALRFNSKLTALNLHGVRKEGAIYLGTPRTLLGGAHPLPPPVMECGSAVVEHLPIISVDGVR